MSLISSKYLEPVRGGLVGRHGAHYHAKALGGDVHMAMEIYNIQPHRPDEKICPKCLRTPFSDETKICPRCGSEM